MPDYELSVTSFTPPTFPEIPEGTQPEQVRSPLIVGALEAATSPLQFTLSLPGARPTNPLHPATHIQLTYTYPNSGEVYLPHSIMPSDLVRADAGDERSTLYDVELGPKDIARAKVNEGESPDAEVKVYVWRNEKLLGKWTVGIIKGLGLEGLKSFDVAKRRVEYWKEQKAKKEAAA